MIALALASLALAMPVTCAPAGDHGAHYVPRDQGGPAIVVLEPYCDEVRQGTPTGAWLLGHELGHAWQDALRRPFDEREADTLGNRWQHDLWVRLGAHRAPAVRLGP